MIHNVMVEANLVAVENRIAMQTKKQTVIRKYLEADMKLIFLLSH